MNGDHQFNGKVHTVKGLATSTLGSSSMPSARANASWTSIEQSIVDTLVDQVMLLSASTDGLPLSGHSIWLRIFRCAGVLDHGHLRRHHLANVEAYLRAWVIRLRAQLPPTQRTPGWRRNIISRIIRRTTELQAEQRLAGLLRTCHAINIEDLTDPQLEAVFAAVTGWKQLAANVA